MIETDAWICPRCYKLDPKLGDHLVHLNTSPKCMKETLSPNRRQGGVCHCLEPKVTCQCKYRRVK